ncbi:MAG: hypothetical protein WC479_08245 [Candidatus Izemoplasmatales bacterium]
MSRSRLPQKTIDAMRACTTDRELIDLTQDKRYNFVLYRLTGVEFKEQADKIIAGLFADKFFVDPQTWYAGFTTQDRATVIPELERRLKKHGRRNREI